MFKFLFGFKRLSSKSLKIALWAVFLATVFYFPKFEQASAAPSIVGEVLAATTVDLRVTATAKANFKNGFNASPTSFVSGKWSYTFTWSRTIANRNGYILVSQLQTDNKYHIVARFPVSVNELLGSSGSVTSAAIFNPNTTYRLSYYSKPYGSHSSDYVILRSTFVVPSGLAGSTSTTDNTTTSQFISPGSIVNINGIVYLVSSKGLYGFPSAAVFGSWGYSASQLRNPTAEERNLPLLGDVPVRLSNACANPLNQIAGSCNTTIVPTSDNSSPLATGDPKSVDGTASQTNTCKSYLTAAGATSDTVKYIPYLGDTSWAGFLVPPSNPNDPTNANYLDGRTGKFNAGQLHNLSLYGTQCQYTVVAEINGGGGPGSPSARNNVAVWSDHYSNIGGTPYNPYDPSRNLGSYAVYLSFSRGSTDPLKITLNGISGNKVTLYLINRMSGRFVQTLASSQPTSGTIQVAMPNPSLNDLEKSIPNQGTDSTGNGGPYFIRAVSDDNFVYDSSLFNLVFPEKSCPGGTKYVPYSKSNFTGEMADAFLSPGGCFGNTPSMAFTTNVNASGLGFTYSMAGYGWDPFNSFIGKNKFSEFPTGRPDLPGFTPENGAGVVVPDTGILVRPGDSGHLDFVLPASTYTGNKQGYETGSASNPTIDVYLVQFDSPCPRGSGKVCPTSTYPGSITPVAGAGYAGNKKNWLLTTVTLDPECPKSRLISKGIPGLYCVGHANFTIPGLTGSDFLNHYYFIDYVARVDGSEWPMFGPRTTYNGNVATGLTNGIIYISNGDLKPADTTLVTGAIDTTAGCNISSTGNESSGSCLEEIACASNEQNLVNVEGFPGASYPIKQCYKSTINSISTQSGRYPDAQGLYHFTLNITTGQAMSRVVPYVCINNTASGYGCMPVRNVDENEDLNCFKYTTDHAPCIKVNPKSNQDIKFGFNMDSLTLNPGTGYPVNSADIYFVLRTTSKDYSSGVKIFSAPWIQSVNGNTPGFGMLGNCGPARGQVYSTAPDTSLRCAPGNTVSNFTQFSGKNQWWWTCKGTDGISVDLCSTAVSANGGSPVLICGLPAYTDGRPPFGLATNGCSSTYKHCRVTNAQWDNTCNITNLSSIHYEYDSNCLAGSVEGNIAGGVCPSAGGTTTTTTGGTGTTQTCTTLTLKTASSGFSSGSASSGPNGTGPFTANTNFYAYVDYGLRTAAINAPRDLEKNKACVWDNWLSETSTVARFICNLPSGSYNLKTNLYSGAPAQQDNLCGTTLDKWVNFSSPLTITVQ